MAAIYTVGDTKIYSTIQDAVDAIPGDLSGQGVQTVEVYGKAATSNKYTEQVNASTGFSNYGAADYISFIAMLAHGGLTQDAGGTGVLVSPDVAADGAAFNICPFTRVDGFEIGKTTITNRTFYGVYSVTSQQGVIVRNNIVHHMLSAGSTKAVFGIYLDGNAVEANPGLFYNNQIFRLEETYGNRNTYGIAVADNDARYCSFQNNTIYYIVGGPTATATYGLYLRSNDATPIVENNYIGNCLTRDFYVANGAPTLNNNISADDTADDYGGSNNLVSKAAADQFVDVTDNSEDFNLKEGADCIDTGKDLSGTFTTDCIGTTRAAPWDVGAFNYAVAATSVITKSVNLLYNYHKQLHKSIDLLYNYHKQLSKSVNLLYNYLAPYKITKSVNLLYNYLAPYKITKSVNLLYNYTASATYKSLSFTTSFLKNAIHKFRLFTVDNLGNKTQADSDIQITIDGYPEPVTNIVASYDSETGTVTISWTASPDADEYEIYSNDGDADIPAPNFQSGLLDTTSDTSYETGILADGVWYFGIRVKNADGLREENLIRIGPIYVPSESTSAIPDDPGVPGDENENGRRYSRMEFERESVGKLTLSFLYFGGSVCTHFHVYIGVGEEPDFEGVPTYEFNRQNGYRQEYTTTNALHSEEDKTVYVAVKAASVSNIESLAEDIYQIDVDCIAPTAPSNITITKVP